jgi:hypothetical protein
MGGRLAVGCTDKVTQECTKKAPAMPAFLVFGLNQGIVAIHLR